MRPKRKQKRKRGDYPRKNGIYQLGFFFSFFPLNFPPFLDIDHLENVSMRYRYPKVVGYRVLGIDIDPALSDCEAQIYRLPRHGTTDMH